MADINLWSVDAENNNMTPPHGWPEGMNYSAVNDAARENMAATKRWFDDISGKLDATGQANLYAVTLNAGYSSYFRGMTFRCKIPATNTGASTINVNAIGPRNIVRADGSALKAGMLQQGHAYSFYFDGTSFRVDATTLVPDAALSSNVPLKNAVNVFTVQQTIQRTVGSPTLTVERIGSAVNAAIEAKTTEGSVYFGNSDGSTFAIGASNNLGPAPWVTVSSTEFKVNAALLDFNGNADISGTLAVGGTITGNGSGLTSLNASNLSSGTVPDARLSSNVPLKNAANVFSGDNTFSGTLVLSRAGSGANAALQIVSAGPNIRFYETDAESGSRAWTMGIDSHTWAVRLNTSDDGTGVGIPLLWVTRSGPTATQAGFAANEISLTGNTTVTGTLNTTGAATFSSNVTVGGAATFSAQTAIIGSHSTDTRIRRNDTTGALLLLGGTGNTRASGARINLYGTDHSTQPGDLAIFAGTGGTLSVSAGSAGTVALDGGTIMLNGVDAADFARKSQANTFTAAQTISAATPFWRLEETDQGTDGKNWLGVSSGGSLSIRPYTDALTAGTGGLTMARSGATVTGAVLAATAIQLDGATRAATIANSTSTTLTPGQIHHVTGNCTVPTLAAGQWVAIVNHSPSPITLTRRSGTALYWTLTGENSATVTIGPRGRVVVSCAASGSDYVSGDIVGST